MLAVMLAAVACAERQQSTDTPTTAAPTAVATAVKRSPTPTAEGQQSTDTPTTAAPTAVATAAEPSPTPTAEGQQSTDTLTTAVPTAVETAAEPSPSPTPEPEHPALEGAVEALQAASSFGFVEHLKSSIHHGPALKSAEGGFEAIGNFQSPDNFAKRASLPDYANRQAIQVDSISLGGEEYLSDPATGEWMPLHDELRLSYDYERFLYSSPVDRFFSVVHEGDPYNYQGIINLDGVRVHHFVSTQLRRHSVRSDGPLHIEIWIGVDDLLVRKMTRSYSWEDNYCNGAEICPDILIIPGSEFYSLQLSFPGEETPIVAPPQGEAETVEGPFGPMVLFEHLHVPFSIQYPSGWRRDLQVFNWKLAVFWDRDNRGRGLSIETEFVDEISFGAWLSECSTDYDESWQPWCKPGRPMLSILEEGALTAENWTDYLMAASRRIGGLGNFAFSVKEGSRRGYGDWGDSSGETMDIGLGHQTRVKDVIGRRLTIVQEMQAGHSECEPESRHCFAVIHVNYWDLNGPSATLLGLADHSFSTVLSR